MRRSTTTPCLLSLAVLAGAGCRGGSTEPAQDLRVTVTVAPTAFRAGDAVRVTTDVVNEGTRSRTIDANTCPGPFVVQTAAGATVWPAGEVCTLVIIKRALAPGERITFTGRWTGNVRTARQDLAPVYATPGTYVVRGRVRVVDDGAVVSDAVSVEVTR